MHATVNVSKAARNGLALEQTAQDNVNFVKAVLIPTNIFPGSPDLPKYSSSLPKFPTKSLNNSSRLPKKFLVPQDFIQVLSISALLQVRFLGALPKVQSPVDSVFTPALALLIKYVQHVAR